MSLMCLLIAGFVGGIILVQIDCKAGTTAEGQNLLANISTSTASLLQGQTGPEEDLLCWLKYWPLTEFCPSAVVPAFQSIWFYKT